MRTLIALGVTFGLLLIQPGFAQDAAAPSPQASVEDSLRRGAEAIRAGKGEEAEKFFQAAVDADPGNTTALMELGLAELRLGKPEAAAERLSQAIAQAPN